VISYDGGAEKRKGGNFFYSGRFKNFAGVSLLMESLWGE